MNFPFYDPPPAKGRLASDGSINKFYSAWLKALQNEVVEKAAEAFGEIA